MSKNTIRIDAPPDDVYAVLTDADAYKHWVVGSKRIRGVDPGWPKSGTRFHHEVGAGPATIKDSTKITKAKKNRRLDLDVRFRPVGTAHVTLDLVPKRRGRETKVTMTEHPTGGLVRRVWSRPLDVATHLRNAWSLARLRRLVEKRARQAS